MIKCLLRPTCKPNPIYILGGIDGQEKKGHQEEEKGQEGQKEEEIIKFGGSVCLTLPTHIKQKQGRVINSRPCFLSGMLI